MKFRTNKCPYVFEHKFSSDQSFFHLICFVDKLTIPGQTGRGKKCRNLMQEHTQDSIGWKETGQNCEENCGRTGTLKGAGQGHGQWEQSSKVERNIDTEKIRQDICGW
jgi:hypothetical protein